MNRPQSYRAEHCLWPQWPAPDNVLAFTTTRLGGCSEPPYSSWNTATHVGDRPPAVALNRQRLQQGLADAAQLHWLDQVHGVEIVQPAPTDADAVPSADGWYCEQARQACCIQTADCLPILLCSLDGRAVAALHAGWRGLAAGIIERGIARFGCPPEQLLAWVGPGISAPRFRVGADVREQLMAADAQAAERCFRPDETEAGYFYADLAGLAELRCRACGVDNVFQSACCSFDDETRFYSYRRSAHTGRNTTVIMLR